MRRLDARLMALLPGHCPKDEQFLEKGVLLAGKAAGHCLGFEWRTHDAFLTPLAGRRVPSVGALILRAPDRDVLARARSWRTPLFVANEEGRALLESTRDWVQASMPEILGSSRLCRVRSIQSRELRRFALGAWELKNRAEQQALAPRWGLSAASVCEVLCSDDAFERLNDSVVFRMICALEIYQPRTAGLRRPASPLALFRRSELEAFEVAATSEGWSTDQRAWAMTLGVERKVKERVKDAAVAGLVGNRQTMAVGDWIQLVIDDETSR